MIHSITPDYSYRHVCHYCSKRDADSQIHDCHDLYLKINNSVEYGTYFGKGHLKSSLKYLTTKVEVPCCKYCYKKRDIGSNIGLVIMILFALSMISYGLYLAILRSDAGIFFSHLIAGLLLAVVTGGVATLICSFFIDLIFNTSHQISNYPPVQKLKKLGFKTIEPSAGILPRTYRLPSEQHINEVCENIRKENHCKIW